MPLSLTNLTRVLIQDGRASKNDAEILTRVVEAGHASRDELASAKDVIESSGLSIDKKRLALQKLESFLDESATGLEANLFGVDPGLANRLRYEGVDSLGKLLSKAATPAQRQSLANELGTDEKTLRTLAKQADLQRVPGLDDKLAHVLIDQGIDSVPELAGRNVDNLHAKLKEFNGTQEAFIIKFHLPTKAELADMVSEAGGLDRALSFGRPTSGWEALTPSERVDMMMDEDSSLTTNWVDESATDFFARHDLDRVASALPHLKLDAGHFIAGNLEYNGAPDATGEAIANGTFTEADLDDDSYAEWSTEPSVTEFLDGDGKLLGAKLEWSISIDPAEYSISAYYDHVEGRFTESIEYDHYNSEVNYRDDYFITSPSSGSVAAVRNEKLKDLSEGLLYISESDHPFEPTARAFGGPPLSEARVRDKLLWSDSSAEISIGDADRTKDFWEYYTDADIHSPADAAKFTALKEYMEEHLTDLRIIKTGEPGASERRMWLVGFDDAGNLQGLTARSIET
jgi:hypothetical protein